MRKNKMRLLLGALVLWATAEVAHQAYVSSVYRFCGRFYWPYYACERNRPAIARLYNLATSNRAERAYAEIRYGRVIDSVGHLPSEARALVLQLAHDTAPAGHFYFNISPVQNLHNEVALTGPCPRNEGCNCMDMLPPTKGSGYLFQLSSSSTEPHHTSTDFEYIRVSNSSLQATLQQRPCYVQTGYGDFLNAQSLRPGFPLLYNDDQTDLLITKILRTAGLL